MLGSLRAAAGRPRQRRLDDNARFRRLVKRCGSTRQTPRYAFRSSEGVDKPGGYTNYPPEDRLTRFPDVVLPEEAGAHAGNRIGCAEQG